MRSLEARDLTVRYQGKRADLLALDSVNLTVNPGQFVSMIGPSGCGKSTLLHCLGGLALPSSGYIYLDQSPLTSPDPSRVAFVFQEYTLLPWKNVVDNAAIGLRFAHVKKRERRRRAEEMLELVGLSEYATSYPHELSGGMQQRVAIARALAMDPDVLLMDEPLGALDEQTRRSLGVEMTQVLTEQGKTVVMVTHSLDEALFWADSVVVMGTTPGRVIETLTYSVPRPRTAAVMSEGEFVEKRGHLMELLAHESMTRRAAASSVEA